MLPHVFSFASLYRISLNTLLVSLPEEIFLVMFTLIVMGEFDILEVRKRVLFDKWDYKRVLIPAVITSLVSNILRYSGVSYIVHFLVFFMTIYVCIVLMGDLLHDSMASVLSWMGRAFVALLFGGIIIFSAELSYVPLILQITGDDVNQLNSNLLLNFVCSIPARLIQYSILIYLIAKKTTLLHASYLKLILKSKILTFFFVGIVSINFFYMVTMVKLIAYDKVLSLFTFYFQIMILIATCIFPFLNIGALVWAVYYIYNRQSSHIDKTAQKINIILQNIKLYTNKEKYDNINWEMNKIIILTEEIREFLQNEH